MKSTQSLAGYIRQHLHHLESRLDFGIRQDVIVQELAQLGYKTSVQGFRNYLYRARISSIKKSALSITTPQQQKEKKNALSVKQNPSQKMHVPPSNPLTKKMGFEYKGTIDLDENDLI